MANMRRNSPTTSGSHGQTGVHSYPTTMRSKASVMLCYKCNQPRMGKFGPPLIVCKACGEKAVHGPCWKRDLDLKAGPGSVEGWVCGHCSRLPGRLPISDGLKTAPGKSIPHHALLASTTPHASAAADSPTRCKPSSKTSTSRLVCPVTWVEHSALPIEVPSRNIIIDEAGISVTGHDTTKPTLQYNKEVLQQVLCVVNGSICQLCLSLECHEKIFLGLKEKTDYRAVLRTLKSLGLSHITSKSGDEYTRLYEQYLDKTYHRRVGPSKSEKQVNSRSENVTDVSHPAGANDIGTNCKPKSRLQSPIAESISAPQTTSEPQKDSCFKIVSSQSFELSPPPSRSPSIERKRNMPGDFAIYSNQRKAKRARFSSEMVSATLNLLNNAAHSSDEDNEDAITLSKVAIGFDPPQMSATTTIRQHQPYPSRQVPRRHLETGASHIIQERILSHPMGSRRFGAQQAGDQPAALPIKATGEGWTNRPDSRSSIGEMEPQSGRSARSHDFQTTIGGSFPASQENLDMQLLDQLEAKTPSLRYDRVDLGSHRQDRATSLQPQTHETPFTQLSIPEPPPTAPPSTLHRMQSMIKYEEAWKAWRADLLSAPLTESSDRPHPPIPVGGQNSIPERTSISVEKSVETNSDPATRHTSITSSSDQVSLAMRRADHQVRYATASTERSATPERHQDRSEVLSNMSKDNIVRKLNQDLVMKNKQLEEKTAEVRKLRDEKRRAEDEHKMKEKIHSANKEKARREANKFAIELGALKKESDVLKKALQEAKSQTPASGEHQILQSRLKDAAEEITSLKQQVVSLQMSRAAAQIRAFPQVDQTPDSQAIGSATNLSTAPEKSRAGEDSGDDRENALDAIFAPTSNVPLVKSKPLLVNRNPSSMLWQWGKMRAEKDISGKAPKVEKASGKAAGKVEPKNACSVEVHIPRLRLDEYHRVGSPENEDDEPGTVHLAASDIQVFNDPGDNSDESPSITSQSRSRPQVRTSAQTRGRPTQDIRDTADEGDGCESSIDVGRPYDLVTSDLPRPKKPPPANSKALAKFNKQLGAPEEAFPTVVGASKTLSYKELEARSKRGRKQKDTTKPSFPVGYS